MLTQAARRSSTSLRAIRAAWARGRKAEAAALLLGVFAQILLGIFTLLSGVDITIAAGHQAMAVVLLGTMILTAHRLGERRS